MCLLSWAQALSTLWVIGGGPQLNTPNTVTWYNHINIVSNDIIMLRKCQLMCKTRFSYHNSLEQILFWINMLDSKGASLLLALSQYSEVVRSVTQMFAYSCISVWWYV